MSKPAASQLNVAMIGLGFMGRAHSNAWGQVNRFFKPPMQAVMHTVAGKTEDSTRAFAEKWGWQHCDHRLGKTCQLARHRFG